MVGAALVSLTPIAVLSDILILAAHLPAFVVQLGYAISLACRVRSGQLVAPVALAGVVGGLGTSFALMGFMAIGVLEDGTTAVFYFVTWALLPILALVGSGLAAALTGLCRLIVARNRASEPAR